MFGGYDELSYGHGFDVVFSWLGLAVDSPIWFLRCFFGVLYFQDDDDDALLKRIKRNV